MVGERQSTHLYLKEKAVNGALMVLLMTMTTRLDPWTTMQTSTVEGLVSARVTLS